MTAKRRIVQLTPDLGIAVRMQPIAPAPVEAKTLGWWDSTSGTWTRRLETARLRAGDALCLRQEPECVVGRLVGYGDDVDWSDDWRGNSGSEHERPLVFRRGSVVAVVGAPGWDVRFGGVLTLTAAVGGVEIGTLTLEVADVGEW